MPERDDDLALDPIERPGDDAELGPAALRAARHARRLTLAQLAAAIAAKGIFCDHRQIQKWETGERRITPFTGRAVRLALSEVPAIGARRLRTADVVVDQGLRRTVTTSWLTGLRRRQARRMTTEHWATIRRTLELAEQVESATAEDLVRARDALRALDETPLILLTCAGLPPSSTDRTPALFSKLDLFRDTVARMVRALR